MFFTTSGNGKPFLRIIIRIIFRQPTHVAHPNDPTEDIPKTLAERIKQCRERKGWRRNKLARMSVKPNGKSINPSYISQLEKGEKTNPSSEVLKAIANALGVSEHYLHDGK